MKPYFTGLAFSALAFALPACHQTDPGLDSSGDGTADGTGDGGDGDGGDFHPLVDGGMWSYRHTRADATVWTEIVEMQAQEYQGMPAFLVRDNEDAQGEITESVLVRDGDLVLRVHKDVTAAGTTTMMVDYVPGFLRFDESWQVDDYVDWTYERTEYDGGGMLVMVNDRLQQFTVESLSASVTVPAGTFDGCAQIRRVRPDNMDQDRYWFAPGIGKVKHEDLVTGAKDELATYDLP